MVGSQMGPWCPWRLAPKADWSWRWLSTNIKYPGKIISVIHLLNYSSFISCFLHLQFSHLLSRTDAVMMRKGNSGLGLCKADLREDFSYKFASQLIKHIFTGIQVAINLKPMMFRISQVIWFDNLRRLFQSCWSKSTSSIYEFMFLDGFWISLTPEQWKVSQYL